MDWIGWDDNRWNYNDLFIYFDILKNLIHLDLFNKKLSNLFINNFFYR